MSVPVQPDWPQPSHPHLFEVRHAPSPSSSGTEFNTSAHSLVSLPPGALFVQLTSPPLTLTTTKAYSSIQLSRNEHAELHSDLLYVNHSCEPSLVFDMAKREVRVAARRAVRPGRVEGLGVVEGEQERRVEGKEQVEGEPEVVVEGQEEQQEQVVEGQGQEQQEGTQEEQKEKQQEQQKDQEQNQEHEERGLEPGDELTFFYPSSEWSMAQPFECRCGSPVCKGWIGGAKEMGRERMRGMWLNVFIEELLDEQEREAATATAEAKDGEATAAATVKDAEATATAKDGEQPTVKERSKRTERKGSCNVQ